MRTLFFSRFKYWLASKAARSTSVRRLVLSQYKLQLRFDGQDLVHCPLDLLLAYQDYLAGVTAGPGKFHLTLEGPRDGN